MTRRNLLSWVAVFLAVSVAACGYYRIAPKSIDPGQLTVRPPLEIKTPAKAPLKDGGVVLFPDGLRVDGGLLGNGEKYDLTRQSRTLVQRLALEDVASLDHYDKELRSGTSTAASACFCAGAVRSLAVRTIHAAGVDGPPAERTEEILASLRDKDRNYLLTSPGASHTLFSRPKRRRREPSEPASSVPAVSASSGSGQISFVTEGA